MLASLEEKLEKWINECFEEKMFDDEIANIYFVIVTDKNAFHLELSGSENFSLSEFDYHTKAGEYFFFDYSSKKEDFANEICFLLKDILKNNSIKNILKNKKIYIIYFQEKIIKKIK